MPDQRKKGKKQVTVWLSPEERAALRQLAKATGTTMTEILKEKIYEYIETKQQLQQHQQQQH